MKQLHLKDPRVKQRRTVTLLRFFFYIGINPSVLLLTILRYRYLQTAKLNEIQKRVIEIYRSISLQSNIQELFTFYQHSTIWSIPTQRQFPPKADFIREKMLRLFQIVFFPNIIHIATKAEEYIYLKIGKIGHLNALLKRQIVEMFYKMVFFVFRFIQTYHLVKYIYKRWATIHFGIHDGCVLFLYDSN